MDAEVSVDGSWKTCLLLFPSITSCSLMGSPGSSLICDWYGFVVRRKDSVFLPQSKSEETANEGGMEVHRVRTNLLSKLSESRVDADSAPAPPAHKHVSDVWVSEGSEKGREEWRRWCFHLQTWSMKSFLEVGEL